MTRQPQGIHLKHTAEPLNSFAQIFPRSWHHVISDVNLQSHTLQRPPEFFPRPACPPVCTCLSVCLPPHLPCTGKGIRIILGRVTRGHSGRQERSRPLPQTHLAVWSGPSQAQMLQYTRTATWGVVQSLICPQLSGSSQL